MLYRRNRTNRARGGPGSPNPPKHQRGYGTTLYRNLTLSFKLSTAHLLNAQELTITYLANRLPLVVVVETISIHITTALLRFRIINATAG